MQKIGLINFYIYFHFFYILPDIFHIHPQYSQIKEEKLLFFNNFSVQRGGGQLIMPTEYPSTITRVCARSNTA
jgi:hypothetical protein